MRRRRLLASLVAAGTAGCLELESAESTAARRTTARTRATTRPAAGDGTGEATNAEEPTDEETTTEEPREYTEPAWTFAPEGELVRPPVVVDDAVVTAAEREPAYALDAENGSERWTTDADVAGRRRPVVVDDTVVFSNVRGMTAVAAGDGRERWRADANISSRPAVDGRTLYAYGFEYSQELAAVDVDTGSVQWSREPESGLGGARSTVFVDGVVVDTHYKDAVYGFDAANGDQLWSFPNPKDGTEPIDLATDGTRVFATYSNSTSGGAGPLVALDPADGSLQWSQHEDGETLESSPYLVAHDDTLYVSHTGLHAVDPTNGFTKWFNEDVHGIVTPADGTVYVGSGGHDGVVLYALNPETGRITGRVHAAYADAWGLRPAIADDRAYLLETTADGNRLAAYDLPN
ncbi:PQQ-binding-like beta-propeller repeat protein [Halorubellus sp. PRR65]|uniref:outer membrane protein assembly factor BamB family protein n=1 Tax=Halorubellus sp. PRR65 TaxID=3098148 RepID=UPI002B25E48F|nr:PQQ-binding-like beta-propeller repeat protein [Halorubellus sp. PRR65]